MRKIALAGAALLLLGGGRAGTASEITPLAPARGDTLRSLATAAEEAPVLPQLSGDALAQGPSVRVWAEDDRDLFTSGERTRLLLRTGDDAFVTVLHVGTRGDVEVLFPASPYDDGFVRGRRPYSIPSASGSARAWRVSGTPGIGYVYAIASDEPLDLRSIRGLFPGHAAGRTGERVIYGDPFEALEEIAALVLRNSRSQGWDEGWYSYHVGRRYAYPRYACHDSYGDWYYGTASNYGSCDRVRILLRDHPSYYDTRYYRGDRRVVYASRRRSEPAHRYKERTDVREGGFVERLRPGGPDRSARDAGDAPPPRVERVRESVRRESAAPRQQGTPAPRPRPTLERRRPEQARPVQPGSGGGGRSQPRVERPRPAERPAPRERTERPPTQGGRSEGGSSSGSRVERPQ